MSRLGRAVARTPTTPGSVWKFNWLANHKILSALRRTRGHARGVLLEIGCGSRPFESVFRGAVDRHVGSDLRVSRHLGGRAPDVFAAAEALPFRAAAFDTVLGLSVMNYLREPDRALAEAARVLRPDGRLILEFAQMVPVRDEPHDYFRFTRYAAALLLERAGFEPLEFIPIGGLWARVGLSAIAVLNRWNRGPTRVLTELPVRALYVVLQVGFEALDRVFFTPREVLSHLVVARRRPDQEAGPEARARPMGGSARK